MGDQEKQNELLTTLTDSIKAISQRLDRQEEILARQNRAAADLRADKLSQLNQLLRKGKLKDYKPSSQENLKDWLSMCDNEIYSLASGVCNIDLTGENDLKDPEYIKLLRCKLDFRVIQELEQKFATQEPAISWSNITRIRIKFSLDLLLRLILLSLPSFLIILHLNLYLKLNNDTGVVFGTGFL